MSRPPTATAGALSLLVCSGITIVIAVAVAEAAAADCYSLPTLQSASGATNSPAKRWRRPGNVNHVSRPSGAATTVYNNNARASPRFEARRRYGRQALFIYSSVSESQRPGDTGFGSGERLATAAAAAAAEII
jgi:hypothetical protein